MQHVGGNYRHETSQQKLQDASIICQFASPVRCWSSKKQKATFLFSPSGTTLRALVLLARCLNGPQCGCSMAQPTAAQSASRSLKPRPPHYLSFAVGCHPQNDPSLPLLFPPFMYEYEYCSARSSSASIKKTRRHCTVLERYDRPARLLPFLSVSLPAP